QAFAGLRRVCPAMKIAKSQKTSTPFLLARSDSSLLAPVTHLAPSFGRSSWSTRDWVHRYTQLDRQYLVGGNGRRLSSYGLRGKRQFPRRLAIKLVQQTWVRLLRDESDASLLNECRRRQSEYRRYLLK